jgi:hypothetical protein
MVPLAWMEYRRYRQMEEHSRLFDKGRDPMDVVYLASRPRSASWGLWLSQRLGPSSRQNAIRWAWAYATSVPMMLLLSLALAGLFSCFCQYLLVKGIKDKAPELTDQVADFAEKVVKSLDNASMSWSGGVNGAIDKLDSEINENIFGWVNTTTSAVNGTLNAFVDKMSKALEDTFGDTPLHDPIKDVLNCLIGLKIASFQKGLTWVSENAHVSFPGVKNDTFSLGALAQLSDSDSAADLLANPNEKAKDEITEAINHLIEKMISGIRTEAIIAGVLLLVWVAYVLGGIAYASIQMTRSGKTAYSANDPYIINPALVDNQAATRTQDYPDTAAPPYEYHKEGAAAYEYPVNQAAPYTIQPRPFATFGPRDDVSPIEEKVGQVDSQRAVVESARPGHARASSHGHVGEPSPMDEKSNPFVDPTHPRDEKRNPFAG